MGHQELISKKNKQRHVSKRKTTTNKYTKHYKVNLRRTPSNTGHYFR